jgi:hypothetical protein
MSRVALSPRCDVGIVQSVRECDRLNKLFGFIFLLDGAHPCDASWYFAGKYIMDGQGFINDVDRGSAADRCSHRPMIYWLPSSSSES